MSVSLNPIPKAPPMPPETEAAFSELDQQIFQLVGDIIGRCQSGQEEITKGLLTPDYKSYLEMAQSQAEALHTSYAAVDCTPMDKSLHDSALKGLVKAVDNIDYCLERDMIIGRVSRLLLANGRIMEKSKGEGIDLGTAGIEAQRHACDILERLEEMNYSTDAGRGLLRITGQNVHDQVVRVNNLLLRKRRYALLEKTPICAQNGINHEEQRALKATILEAAKAELCPDDSRHFMTVGAMNEIFERSIKELAGPNA